MAPNLESTSSELNSKIEAVYGEIPSELATGLESLLSHQGESTGRNDTLWDENDVVLITYADQIRDDSGSASPLATLNRFLLDHELQRLIRCVHLLPFCPYTSDDGFSVVDYLAVDPESGTWDDIGQLGEHFDLMYDLVLNHCSQQHAWMNSYLAGDSEYTDFFHDVDPRIDLSGVTRPRSLPLLTKFESAEGDRHIWTTFSADQVDLNYANPRVMLRMIETLVEYARRGARIIRLDAIAYLWKEIGTSCIHLPQTHAAVKLMRYVLDHTVPGTLILTETNVPHKENISYFGSGDDEAHMVYQFSLPPLMLDAIHSGKTDVLKAWLSNLKPVSDETTFFNFTASHDGVGVRPLEGLVSSERIANLVSAVQQHGGRVNFRRNPDGTDSPYEMNITYLDAVADSKTTPAAEHCRRFMATQAIMLAMQGVPAVYFHSLVGTENDHEGVESSGQNRRINRRKFDLTELNVALQQPDSLQRRVFDSYQKLLAVRKDQPAFHPRASQTTLDLPTDGLIGFVRELAGKQKIAVIANLSNQPRTIDATTTDLKYDLLADESISGDRITLRPFQVRWLV